MSYKLLFVVNAFLAVVLGAAFLLVPAQSLGFFRAEQYAATLLMGRFFGSAMIALGLVLWFVKDTRDESVQKMVAISLLVSSILGLIVNIIGISSGIVRVNGWITIIVYVLFALGYSFMLFLKPKMKE
ncbi:MAG TPA: hypothetical protein DCX53_16175 [Anaerolineae bacterium]|nr:hypothetical protein [Anaerolineae bacterium]